MNEKVVRTALWFVMAMGLWVYNWRSLPRSLNKKCYILIGLSATVGFLGYATIELLGDHLSIGLRLLIDILVVTMVGILVTSSVLHILIERRFKEQESSSKSRKSKGKR